jgi:amidohydrolase
MGAEAGSRIDSEIDRVGEEVVETRRDLHRHPEIAHQERRTAELVAARCAEMGFEVRTEVGGTGVVADLDSGNPGPTVMYRADMDGLPISERGEDGRLVRSEVEGVMHACGHDGHVAIALGVARVMTQIQESWKGRLRLCFQPAEEIAGGAEPMIGAGALDGVNRVLGIHLWAPLDAGRVAVTPGPIFGSADEFRIVVHGRGGHGGLPHTSVDPVVAAAHVVVALQTLISRETPPDETGVITVGQIEGGQAFNVIAEQTWLRGTVRAVAAGQRERLLRRLEELARGVAGALGCGLEFERGFGCPPVVSDAVVAEAVRLAAIAAVGEDLVEVARPISVGDDVALFLDKVPGCYFLVGAGDPRKEQRAPHHHPEFDIDERCLGVGVRTMTNVLLDSLQ